MESCSLCLQEDSNRQIRECALPRPHTGRYVSISVLPVPTEGFEPPRELNSIQYYIGPFRPTQDIDTSRAPQCLVNILSWLPFVITYILFCCVVYCRAQLSHTGTRTRVCPVKAGYPNHLDYMGCVCVSVLPNTSGGIRTHEASATELKSAPFDRTREHWYRHYRGSNPNYWFQRPAS